MSDEDNIPISFLLLINEFIYYFSWSSEDFTKKSKFYVNLWGQSMESTNQILPHL